MSDEPLRSMLMKAAEQLRGTADLTLGEILGLRVLPESSRTPDVCYALGVIEGAAAALGATPQELLEDYDLYTAKRRKP